MWFVTSNYTSFISTHHFTQENATKYKFGQPKILSISAMSFDKIVGLYIVWNEQIKNATILHHA